MRDNLEKTSFFNDLSPCVKKKPPACSNPPFISKKKRNILNLVREKNLLDKIQITADTTNESMLVCRRPLIENTPIKTVTDTPNKNEFIIDETLIDNNSSSGGSKSGFDLMKFCNLKYSEKTPDKIKNTQPETDSAYIIEQTNAKEDTIQTPTQICRIVEVVSCSVEHRPVKVDDSTTASHVAKKFNKKDFVLSPSKSRKTRHRRLPTSEFIKKTIREAHLTNSKCKENTEPSPSPKPQELHVKTLRKNELKRLRTSDFLECTFEEKSAEEKSKKLNKKPVVPAPAPPPAHCCETNRIEEEKTSKIKKPHEKRLRTSEFILQNSIDSNNNNEVLNTNEVNNFVDEQDNFKKPSLETFLLDNLPAAAPLNTDHIKANKKTPIVIKTSRGAHRTQQSLLDTSKEISFYNRTFAKFACDNTSAGNSSATNSSGVDTTSHSSAKIPIIIKQKNNTHPLKPNSENKFQALLDNFKKKK